MTKRNKLIVSITAAFLALVIVILAVFGAVTLVRRANAVASYRGTTVDAGEYAYLSTYAKAMWFSSLIRRGVTPHDAKYFYAITPAGGTKTYGEMLDEFTASYVSRVLISASYYDSLTSLSRSDRQAINKAVDDLVTYRAGGDKSAFAEAIAPYGFTLSDVRSVATLVYKADRLREVLYGADYAGVSDYADFCDEYLSEHYTHVNLLVIRTTDTFLLDENGNRVTGPDGRDETRPYTAEERETIAGKITELDDAILARETGVGDAVMTPEMFSYYLDHFDDGDKTYRDVGYYFGEEEAFTTGFVSVYPELVSTAFSMEIGAYRKVWLSDIAAWCYLYRQPTVSGAYAAKVYEAQFESFAANAASGHLSSMLGELEGDVVFTDLFHDTDFRSLPYQTDYFVRFS